MNKKIVWGIVGIVIIVVLIIGIGVRGNRSNNSTVKIGALFPLTGGLAIYGEPAQKAAQLAVRDINASGGVNGKQLEVVFEDHQCSPATAVSAFEKLSAQGVRVFTSVACSGTVLGIAPELKNNQAVLVGTTVTTPKITGVSPYVFRNWASDIQESKLFADQIQAKGYKKIGEIYEVTDYAKGVAVNLQGFLKDSGVAFDAESFIIGDTDVRTQLTKLKAFKPDVILVSVQTVTSGEIVLKQMEQLGVTTKLFITDNLTAVPQIISAHSTLLEGAVGAEFILRSLEKATTMLSDYKTKYGADCTQPTVCAGVYDAVQMLAKAIQSNGYTADGVKQYLNTISYDGSSGLIQFDQNNDRANAIFSLFLVKNGKAILVQ
jgi:branched-chain amino acid transport system substrate-binding protein